MGPGSAIHPHGATVGHNRQISTRVGLRSLPWVTETERADSMAGRWSVRNRFNHAHTHATLSLINFSKLGSETSSSQGMSSLSISPQRGGGSYGRKVEQISIEAAQPNLDLATLDRLGDRN